MIEQVVTSGTFSLDGQDFEVDNNIWLVGNDSEVVVVDAAHDHRPIIEAIGSRRVVGIVATHGHNDHINAAAALADEVGAPIWLHPDDRPLWDQVYPSRPPDADLIDGLGFEVGGSTLGIIHTPGHTPGGCSLHDAGVGVVFTGDTLFRGGPGATGRSFSDFPTIIESIRHRLLTLPPETRAFPGHGDETVIGDEAPHLEEWIARGH
ncbi:MAG TPA: MBL fold metallo-hydrolase [Acidimicrobiales bacterium]|jgi:glyoxylase-like metal-dependent hydrolase (beta-lactamase superfamily II)|nr:MBL fold metallo-hydrolase [Acidimicrobiales bacterium]